MARAGTERSAVSPCAARWKQERMERERKLDLGDNGMNDFTFCRVDLQADNDLLESPKVIPNVNKITLTDSSISDGNLEKTSDSSRECSSDSLTERNGGWIDFPLNCSSDMIQPKNKPIKLEVREIARSTGDPLLVFEEKLSSRKPAVRAKVPFEKGYSQMDWLKLTGTHPDLAGLKGQSNRRFIPMDEVRQHKTEGSIWTVLKGRVYNISSYMKFHPGGVDMLMKAAGKDCTSLFNKYHAWVNAEFLLEKCLVGVLDNDRRR